jgi:hypothetical protein
VTWNGVYSIGVSGYEGGTLTSSAVTITTVNGGGAASALAYTDYNAPASFPVSFGSWYVAAGSYAFTPSTAGNTYNVNYYLASGTVTECALYQPVGGGTWLGAQLEYLAAAGYVNATLGLTPTCFSAVTNGPWWVQPALHGASATSTERARTQNATSGTFPTPGTTFRFVYFNQFDVALSYGFTAAESSATAPTFYGRQWGGPYTVTLSKTAAAYWLDAGTAWHATNPLVTSPDLKVWYGAPAGGLVDGAGAIGVLYSPKSACTGPWQSQLLAGCFWAGMGPYVTIFGLQGFVGIVMMGVDSVVWVQTKNGWVVALVMDATAAAFGGALPSYFFLFALVLTGASIAGLMLRLFWRRV